MARDSSRSRSLRQLADDYVGQLPGEHLTSSRQDLTTSLVRQWMTYDNNATLILGNEQHYLRPSINLGGALRIEVGKSTFEEWRTVLMTDWEVDESQLPDLIEQLNVGQSAEVENRPGRALRIWLDPKKRARHVDPIGPETAILPKERNFSLVARKQIDLMYGDQLEEPKKSELVASVVHQWATYDGHALILIPDFKFHLAITLEPNLGTGMTVGKRSSELARSLWNWEHSPSEVLQILHQLNLGQKPELTDNRGCRYRLSADPRNATVYREDLPQPKERA